MLSILKRCQPSCQRWGATTQRRHCGHINPIRWPDPKSARALLFRFSSWSNMCALCAKQTSFDVVVVCTRFKHSLRRHRQSFGQRRCDGSSETPERTTSAGFEFEFAWRADHVSHSQLSAPVARPARTILSTMDDDKHTTARVHIPLRQYIRTMARVCNGTRVQAQFLCGIE